MAMIHNYTKKKARKAARVALVPNTNRCELFETLRDEDTDPELAGHQSGCQGRNGGMMAKQLDDYDKDYWAKAVADLKAAGEIMQLAQEKLATARTNVSGFAQYLKSKYDFDDAIEITPDGEILDSNQAVSESVK